MHRGADGAARPAGRDRSALGDRYRRLQPAHQGRLCAAAGARAEGRHRGRARRLAYGAHARQVLDVFSPAGARAAPVMMFVHGGAFVRGDKRVTGELYENVLHWFARQGFVGVNIEYRLAPEAAYPGGARISRWPSTGYTITSLAMVATRHGCC